MLGLIVIATWMVFVAGYLIWQQLSGELSDAVGGRQPAGSHRAASGLAVKTDCAVEASVRRLRGCDDVRRSLVYVPARFSAPAGSGIAAERRPGADCIRRAS